MGGTAVPRLRGTGLGIDTVGRDLRTDLSGTGKVLRTGMGVIARIGEILTTSSGGTILGPQTVVVVLTLDINLAGPVFADLI